MLLEKRDWICRKRLMIKKFLAVVAIVIFFAGNLIIARAQTPPVLAFYYAWFDENTWRSGQSADMPVQPYRSADPATIARQVVQAQNAGINAFVQSWYGPQIENNQTETNFQILLDAAQQSGFKAAVDFEVTGPFFPDVGAVQNALAVLLATHVNHPAYFRYQGKPVIFFWRQQRFSAQTWAQIRQAVDPAHNTIWIAEGTDLSYQSVFDGNHLYSIAWAANVATELNKWKPRLQKIESSGGSSKLWVATAMPGYDDTNLFRADSRRRDRAGGAFYRETWQAARNSRPDMIIITSFNEWLEGSQIEPSVSYGDFYLNLTRELVDSLSVELQPSSAPPPAATLTLPAQPTPSPTPLPTPLPQPPDVVYSIKSGDTLLGIALAFGMDLDVLLAANAISAAMTPAIGQKIILPQMGNSSVLRREILEYRHLPE